MHEPDPDPIVDAFLDVPAPAPSPEAAARLNAGLDAVLAGRPPRTPLPWVWIAALLAGALLAALGGGEQSPARAPAPRDPWQHRPNTPLPAVDLPAEILGDPRTSVRGASE